MDNMPKIDEEIRAAELKRIIAEEQKIISEKSKIDIERKQLEKPFYKRFQFVQFLIAGVVGGLAFLGVLQTIIEPSYKRDIIQKELEIAKKEMQVFELEANIIAERKKSINIVDEHLNNLIENTKSEGLLIATIYFEYDKATIQKEFVNYLQKLSEFLIQNNNIKIKVRGFSSEMGEEAYNIRLSEIRAKAVVNEILKNGVSSDRITTYALGESMFHKDVMENLDKELEKRLYEMKSIVLVTIIE